MATEKEESLGWGSSLPVPSIQEIVRNDSHCIPERYMQREEDRPVLDSTLLSPVPNEIPIINLSLLANGDENERNRLDFACEEYGFFQLTNHGVPAEVLHKMKAAVASFFDLPLVEKQKYAMADNDLQGYGQVFVMSDEQKLDWSDLIFLMTLPPKFRNMKKWPNIIPDFENTLEEYSTELQKVGKEIFANLSVLMGIKRDGLEGMHAGMKLGTRMNYYPTCVRPDLVIGVSPHSDASAITILLQDDDVTALQIKYKGRWLPIEPVPNALVVNIGDAMEVWSNGKYKSVEHRAITNDKKARISVATFFIPDDEVEIGPVETMIDDQRRPRMYMNEKYVNYLRHTFSRKMEGKAPIEILKLANN